MERVKKKKQHRSLSKPLLLLLTVLLILLLTAGLFLLRKTENTVPPPDESAVSAQQTLYTCENSNIDTIQITTPENESYTLQYRDGTLVLPHDDAFVIRDSIVSGIINNAAHIIAEETVLNTRETIVSLDDFGLQRPQCTAVITYHDGTVNTLRVGNQMTFGIPYYYFMWNDDPCIYAVSTDVYEAFSYSFATLHAVTQPYWDSELWDSVTISGENTRTLVRTDFGWQLTEPAGYPLDSAKAETFLTNIENIRFAQYVGKADDLQLSEYGLDKPRLTLTLEQVQSTVSFMNDEGQEVSSATLPAESIVLHCGNAIDDYYFYAEYLGVVYTATRFQLGFLWNSEHEDLYESYPANVDITLLNAVEITADDIVTRYDIRLVEQMQENGDLVTDEQGNVLYDVYVDKNGQSMPSDAFLLWYAQLRQLTGESTLPPDAVYAEEPDVTITLQGESTARTLAFHSMDSVYYALTVDGTAHVYLPKGVCASLLTLP